MVWRPSCRLLNIVRPDLLVLGQKDYQQVVLLERMITDLRLPVAVSVGATHRESDGLASSSRNRYLDDAQRARAPRCTRHLRNYATPFGAVLPTTRHWRWRRGDAREGGAGTHTSGGARSIPARPEVGDLPRDLVVLAAAQLGRARLIDNLRI